MRYRRTDVLTQVLSSLLKNKITHFEFITLKHIEYRYMFLGKVLGFLIGFFTLGPVGALIGLLVGHFFDKGLAGVKLGFDPQKKAEVEQAFFTAVFPLMGHLAKSDGRVSEAEIQGTEQIFAKMGLDENGRAEAISLFKSGTASDFSVDDSINRFIAVCGEYRDLKQILLVYLISMAYADGELHSAEEAILAEVAEKLGYSRIAFNRLMGMISAQAHFYRRQGYQQGGYQQQEGFGPAASQSELDFAYRALGVEASAGDAEVKKAYRKLMSEYHPDKLAGRGVPDEMVKLATERAQEVQSAYDLIKKSRA